MSVGFVLSSVPLALRRSSLATVPLRPSAPHRSATATARRARVVATAASPDEDSAPASAAEEGIESAESIVDAAPEELGAEDILSSPAFLKKKLEVVQRELTEARAAAELAEEALTAEKDVYVRLAADFENYRRRSSKDLATQDSKSTAKVCNQILGVLDNFERAIMAVVPATDREKSINQSYLSINKQLLDALVKLNVTPIEAVGEPFNPELHDAVNNTESKEYAEGIVCTQYQRGYAIEETLIRPAMVVVSSGPGPATAGEEAKAVEEIVSDDVKAAAKAEAAAEAAAVDVDAEEA
jgi:molecular chaperone GrpE